MRARELAKPVIRLALFCPGEAPANLAHGWNAVCGGDKRAVQESVQLLIA